MARSTSLSGMIGAASGRLPSRSSADCHTSSSFGRDGRRRRGRAAGAPIDEHAQASRRQHVFLTGANELAREVAIRRANPVALATSPAVSRTTVQYIYHLGDDRPPKDLILHRNYYAMADESARADGFLMAEDVMLLYLPLAHNFGRLMHLLGPYLGFTLAFCPDPYAVAEALPAVRPTVFPSVPRIYEKIHTNVAARFDEATGMRRALIEGASKSVGAQAPSSRSQPLRRRSPPARLADRLVTRRSGAPRRRFRVGVSGGAPLAEESPRSSTPSTSSSRGLG